MKVSLISTDQNLPAISSLLQFILEIGIERLLLMQGMIPSIAVQKVLRTVQENGHFGTDPRETCTIPEVGVIHGM